MLVSRGYFSLLGRNAGAALGNLLLALTAVGSVTVLLSLATEVGRAQEPEAVGPRVLEFTAESPTALGRACWEGHVLSDGSRWRVAIYWVEPPVLRDSPAFLGCADFIFDAEMA